MAQRKIIWSEEAHYDFLSTLNFYAERNGNKIYSEELAEKIQETTKRIKEHPFIGRPTKNVKIRILKKENFQIYYELKEENIIILIVWDTLRNPEELKKYLP